jgi:hypothetical protein
VIISYCGLICDTCPIHLATLEQDASKQLAMRANIAQICNEKYGIYLLPADINNCDGCKANTGRLFSGCLDCEIRKCANEKNVENCAYCTNYACDKLMKMFTDEPETRQRLDEIRSTIGL